MRFLQHPWPSGSIFSSPGCHFTYRIIGPCCRLFDREQLPWPCCRLQWRGKEPSWRRIGKRLIPDLATKNFPSYCVEILDHGHPSGPPFVITLYTAKLTPAEREWWYAKKLPPAPDAEGGDPQPPPQEPPSLPASPALLTAGSPFVISDVSGNR